MKPDTAVEIIRLAYDTKKHTVGGELNLWICLGILLIALIIILIRYISKRKVARLGMELIEIELEIGGQKAKFEITRNYENLEIAHKLYIELITRKAAIPLDEKHDIIAEIYDSWYLLFKITREEIKNISGKSLQANRQSEELINMATEILNKGLRPHLTEYQAKFRRWYNAALTLEKYKDKSPQQIQSDYPDKDKLFENMKAVNTLLIKYAAGLKKFINNTLEDPAIVK